VRGSGLWHAQHAWLGRPAQNVLLQVVDGRIAAVTEGVVPPPAAIALRGWTIPGLADAHSHAFQRVLRGRVEAGAGDFWEWRKQMYGAAEWDGPAYLAHCREVFREMLEAGITAVGEFHYLHGLGNGLGQAMIDAANTVKPALNDFYGSLSSEQKARFNRIGGELAQSGN